MCKDMLIEKHDIGNGWTACVWRGLCVVTDDVHEGISCFTALDIANMCDMDVETAEKIIRDADENKLRQITGADRDADITVEYGHTGWAEMPGYLDRTENIGVFYSKAECWETLENMYGGDDDE